MEKEQVEKKTVDLKTMVISHDTRLTTLEAASVNMYNENINLGISVYSVLQSLIKKNIITKEEIEKEAEDLMKTLPTFTPEEIQKVKQPISGIINT